MLALVSLALAVDFELSSFLAPFGTTPSNRQMVFRFSPDPSATGAQCPGTGMADVYHGADPADTPDLGGILFTVDGDAVVCDPTADPPCLPRENKPRPTYSTGVIYDPIRVNYDHMKASLRFDVIQVNEDANTEDFGFVAVRSILSLTNPTHVTRHADVGMEYFYEQTDLVTVDDSSVDADDFWSIQHSTTDDLAVLTYTHSPCTDDSHHFKLRSVNDDTPTCSISDGAVTATGKVMVHPGHTSLVVVVQEFFEGSDALEQARRRTVAVARHGDDADLKWFDGLSEKERLSVVNFCVDDDDGETTDDDDSSTTTDTSIDTSDLSDGEFNFEFHEHRCDNPLYSAKDRRYADKFSSEFSTSKIYTSSVERIVDSDTSSSDAGDDKKDSSASQWWEDVIREG